MYRKERPKCRKVIEHLLKEKQCTLEQLEELFGRQNIILSDGLLIQYRKMLEEENIFAQKK